MYVNQLKYSLERDTKKWSTKEGIMSSPWEDGEVVMSESYQEGP